MNMNKRISITFDENEYASIEQMQRWYSETTGVRVSKCGVIKALLFTVWDEQVLKGSKSSKKSFKTSSKVVLEGQ